MMKLVYWIGKHFPTFLFSSPVLKYNFIYFFKELIQEYSEEGALNHHSCDGVLNFVWNQVHVLPVVISQEMVRGKNYSQWGKSQGILLCVRENCFLKRKCHGKEKNREVRENWNSLHSWFSTIKDWNTLTFCRLGILFLPVKRLGNFEKWCLRQACHKYVWIMGNDYTL